MNEQPDQVRTQELGADMNSSSKQFIDTIREEAKLQRKNNRREFGFDKSKYEENARLQPILEKALMALETAIEMAEQIAKADCPKSVSHPQSVWWKEHVQQLARDFLEKVKGDM